VVAHTFNPSTWEAEAGRFLFKVSLVYRVSSGTARATQRNPVSKEKKLLSPVGTHLYGVGKKKKNKLHGSLRQEDSKFKCHPGKFIQRNLTKVSLKIQSKYTSRMVAFFCATPDVGELSPIWVTKNLSQK
jgi:hypothetical protein